MSKQLKHVRGSNVRDQIRSIDGLVSELYRADERIVIPLKSELGALKKVVYKLVDEWEAYKEWYDIKFVREEKVTANERVPSEAQIGTEGPEADRG